MEKSSFPRFLLLALAALLLFIYLPKLWSDGGSEVQPIGIGRTETAEFAFGNEAPSTCTIQQEGRFAAELTARGAALLSYRLTGDSRYTDESGKPLEMMTVAADAPDRLALRADWRAMGVTGEDAQVAKDVADWKLVSQSPTHCTFQYEDDKVALEKTFRVGERPFELVVSSTIENRSDAKKKHRLAIENTAWRRNSEVQGSLGRVSPWMTDVACGAGGKLVRKHLDDFEPDDFKDPEFQHGWFVAPGQGEFAATSSAYFTQAVVPLSGPAPQCALQIEERWFRDQYPDKTKDPAYGAMYRSRLVYPTVELAPGEKATYEQIAFIGPKDRHILAAAVGGQHHMTELIDLGMFSVISKVLVTLLLKIHGVVGSWGIAIIILTLCVRVLLLPLTWKQIQSMLAMRRLKPEIDEINRKYAHDVQQKQIAMMEVYRKNGVNPFGGCLPVLVQMPVWWALYTTLNTAVEFYHTPFLWFSDLSAPDPYFILPIVIGLTAFIQQKLMPQTAMDPAQAKMMLYMMPAIFTVMMLFLPSGLGVYILTNSVLGIVQQQIVEHLAPSSPSGGIEVKEKSPDDDGTSQGPGGSRKIGTLPAKLKG